MLASKFLRIKAKRVIAKSVASRPFISLSKNNPYTKVSMLANTALKMSVNSRGFCALYYEKLYKKYLADPNSVDEAWRRYFENKEVHSSTGAVGGHIDVSSLADQIAQRLSSSNISTGSTMSEQDSSNIAKVLNIVRAYQTVGHEKAKTDPLNLQEKLGDIMQVGKRKKVRFIRSPIFVHRKTFKDLSQNITVLRMMA